jgi:hypothetical protein
MTADAYLVIRCDHVDGGEECDEEWGHPVRVANHTELRRHLKAKGWTRSRGKDFCPDHPKESQR